MQLRLSNGCFMYKPICIDHGITKVTNTSTFSLSNRSDSQIGSYFAPLMPAHTVRHDKKTPVRVHSVLVVSPHPTLISSATPGQSQS